MIQINLVARIDSDKNNFLDLIYIAYKLKMDGLEDFRILFIGPIINTSIYQNIVRMAGLLDVTDKIDFTRKSVVLTELTEETKASYFLNYSIGDFIGYSGVDSIAMRFKTIFVNGEKSLENEKFEYTNICKNIPELIKLIKSISKNTAEMDKQIAISSLKIQENFHLNNTESAYLLGMMHGDK